MDALNIRPDGIYVDGTAGGGGPTPQPLPLIWKADA